MGSISESYSSGPFGLEQRFTVSSPQASSSLVLALKLSGSLQPSQVGSQILFRTSSGETLLRYGQLEAVDATGRSLPAHMRLRDGVLTLDVDARHARYPLTIDPFIQQGDKLTAPGENEAEEFGYSVALSAEGNTALIGAPDANKGGGAAWVFTRSGSTWTPQGPALTPREEVGEGMFGLSVALSDDGNTALIGGLSANDGSGGAWVFARSGSSWTEQAELKLNGSETTEEDDVPGRALFGSGGAVALSADGKTALIAPASSAYLPGAAFLFTGSGSTWTQQAELKLTGSEATAEEEGGGRADFGSSLALSADGHTALIGAPGYGFGKGAAFIFTGSGSNWTQQGGRLTGTSEVGEANFGWSVALSGEGNTALISGGDDAGHTGAAWVFTRSGATWTQQGKKLTGRGETGLGTFGWSVALSAEGHTALIGARADNTQQGAAWIFTRSGSAWSQQGEKLTGSGEAGSANFGSSVALSANASTALIGGLHEAGNAGGAWVFQATSSGTVGKEAGKNATIVIQHVKMTPVALLVTVKTSSKGVVTLSGEDLQKVVKRLAPGVHKLRLTLARTAKSLHQHTKKIKLSAKLRTASKTVSSAKQVDL
jgi:hypothetical protein